jgi:predicted ATPase
VAARQDCWGTGKDMSGMNSKRRRIVLSGCSGGGKSTILQELARRGYHVFSEAGREIVKEQLAQGGTALPWSNEAKFVELLLERSLAKFHAAPAGLSFYDRSFIEPLRWYQQTGVPLPVRFGPIDHLRYADDVFLAPPWPEIHTLDTERRHGFDAAVEEYEALSELIPELGYKVHILPKVSVTDRADFVERTLGLTGQPGTIP